MFTAEDPMALRRRSVPGADPVLASISPYFLHRHREDLVAGHYYHHNVPGSEPERVTINRPGDDRFHLQFTHNELVVLTIAGKTLEGGDVLQSRRILAGDFCPARPSE